MNQETSDPERFFPKTSWTLLVEARGDSPQAQTAREQFMARYHQPVLNYFIALTNSRDRAEDLAQSFFEKIAASGKILKSANRSRGRFRHYLKRSLGNHWKSDIRYRQRQKRDARDEVYPDEWSGAGWERLDVQGSESPEAAFHVGWVRSLLNEALVRVKAICVEKDQTVHYQLFVGMYLSAASSPPSWRELGGAFGLNEKAARSRTETVARHFKSVLREILRDDVDTDESVDDEIAALLSLL